ncbi:hypothetical protein IW140_001033 [Coemansia sp. RSA 1813]|nr:hypothetical protein EV178_004229 [Coemansia sp. RSA 1646]KAJ1770758.1 hypothetical protein LPJ74_002889 [Coemansia sp. RSA 1843]KAJ2091515.1 hypothetical protein IW138_001743 [Coemansia sp. RSA 986]KAJ2215184.1 hypothetical protein EV179_002403 [Coemansia sp. RSA 487]KAJ2572284.1 hypothetical protein IW140_001033 [Coemansia sp. RSA 1813]
MSRPEIRRLCFLHTPRSLPTRTFFAPHYASVSSEFWSQKRYAGHSRWSKIRHSKGASDIKKGQLFSAISKSIITSVKDGGSDIKINLRLAATLKQARLADMPKENIDRAIKRATSKEYSGAEQVVYEGLGPHGTALIIECLTENKNRTVKALRNVLSRFGGALAPVGYMFEKKGRICFSQEGTSHSLDTMFEHAIDAGAEDISELEGSGVEVICEFNELQAVTKLLTSTHGYIVERMEGTYVPDTHANVAEDSIAQVQEMIETIEELEDVIRVHCNL